MSGFVNALKMECCIASETSIVSYHREVILLLCGYIVVSFFAVATRG